MKKTILLLNFFLIVVLANSQARSHLSRSSSKLHGNTFRSLSSDSSDQINAHILKFKTHSIVEIASIPGHMSKQFSVELSYSIVGQEIHILPPHIGSINSIELLNHGWERFIKGVRLKRGNKLLIDSENQLIYAYDRMFDKRRSFFVLMDDQEFKLKMPTTNSYGLIDKNGRKNFRLHRKVKQINEADLERYQLDYCRGINAYNKYGEKYIFGVIEVREIH